MDGYAGRSSEKRRGLFVISRLSVDDLTPDSFRGTLNDRLLADSPVPSFVGKAGPYGVSLGPGTFEFTEAKIGISKQVGRSRKMRSRFAYALLVSSIFQPPIYIGKANDLAIASRTTGTG